MTAEQRKRYQSEYHKLHPENQRAACRRWRQKHLQAELERSRAKGRIYRSLNLAKQSIYMKKWRVENKARIAELGNRRKARKLATQVDPSGIAQWMKDIRTKPFVRCHWCGTKIRGKQIRFDHIVALSRGGPHIISNLCATCVECNSSKGARAIADWICRGQTFLPL